MKNLKEEITPDKMAIIKNYEEMVGIRKKSQKGYVIKRFFDLSDIYISKEEKEIVLKAMNSDLKVLTIGLFSIVLSTISAIEPRRG